MSITMRPLGARKDDTASEYPGVRSLSQRLDLWVTLSALSDPTHQAIHWGKDAPGTDDFDSLAEHLSCLYDECEILPRPERAVGLILRASEVSAMRVLGRAIGAVILELGEAPDSFYLSHPRWPDVIEAARCALVAMDT